MQLADRPADPEAKSSSTRAPREHPRSGEAWFQGMPDAHRERLNREWRAGVERDVALVRRSREDLAREAVEHAGVFLVFDLFCPGNNAWTLVAAIVVGALAGASCRKLQAAQPLSATIGGGSFFLLQWISRGGISAFHLFWFLPVIAACAYLGWRRHA